MDHGDDVIPAQDRYIDALFGEHGYLSRAFPNYRPRPGQVALAEAVDRAIVGRGHLLAEAPTGIGKSLGYSGPASYHAWNSGRTVVIVTANIALQEQIVSKDLPLLQRIVPWPFTFALLKGRNNFLCVDRFWKYRADVASGSIANQTPPAEERRQLPLVEHWAHENIRAGITRRTGDVSELSFEPAPNVWRRFSVTADECKRGRCKYRNECFALAASDRARQAQLVVTNYHMLYAHLRMYLETGFDLAINPFHVAILDEGHKAPDIARDVFGFRISAGSVHRIGRKLRDDDPALGEDVERFSSEFFFRMGDLAKNRDRYKSRLNGNFSDEETSAWDDLDFALVRAATLLEEKLRTLTAELELAKAETPIDEERVDDISDDLGELELLFERTKAIHANLGAAMAPTENARAVFFLEEDEKRRVRVCSRLIHASDALTPGLFEKRVAPPSGGAPGPPVAVVVASATLATTGGDFDFISEELGCPPGYASLVAESPFDWPSQCLFICPRGLPEPNAPEFKDAVASSVRRTIELARGRTLGLFTSRRVLEHTFDAIRERCRELGITLLRQGDAPRTQLLETFKRDISSVLLGTESFWAGVDVPGESLSVVVIDRLPFPTPDDPIVDVLAATSNDWFRKYSIPRSLIAFKQGFGRLIRSLECHGVVVCLDNRLVEKRYGKLFLRAIPAGVGKTTNLDAIADWLGLPLPEAQPAPGPLLALRSTIVAANMPAAPPPPQLALFQPAPPAPPAVVLPPGWDDTSPPALPVAWDE